MNIMEWFREKLNPAQSRIALSEGTQLGTETKLLTHQKAFRVLEPVNRSVNFLVSACNSLDYDVKAKLMDGVVAGVRQKTLLTLLNNRPNPFQSSQEFKQCIFTDFVLEGNAFIHYDGTFMYHLPAQDVEILTDPKLFIRGYRFMGTIDFKEGEVFYIRDINPDSIYRGASRLNSAQRSIDILYSMQGFQEKFFENGAVFGLVLTSENTLSQVAKDRTIQSWLQNYNTKLGGRKPAILDSGLKPHKLSDTTFREMDFDQSIKTHSEKIVTSVGVPPILLYGGNNANISPNLRLFYLEGVLPIARRWSSALERYFGYDIEPITQTVSALQPELKDIAQYNATLVNGGIITPNEARQELRYPTIAGYDTLRIPANITGSASDPSQGGRPSGE
jgi:HK97 family phage portal protein